MKVTEDICPRCFQRTIDRDNRRCLCGQALLFPGDDGHGLEDEEWFMWNPRGVRGPGWYRKQFVTA
jgi:hypothetical protein